MATSKPEENATAPDPPEDAAADTAASTENAVPTKEMRCVTLTGYGGIKMLRVQNWPEVKPMEGEVLIRVKAT